MHSVVGQFTELNCSSEHCTCLPRNDFKEHLNSSQQRLLLDLAGSLDNGGRVVSRPDKPENGNVYRPIND